jgi:16S rRNA (adenine1518-N6/adenine1519-N6)-dimethyltransferase
VRKPARVHGPRPLKELGQHFLQDEEIAADIIGSMGLKWEDRALEIGPGRGVLLRFLLKQSHRVTAVELDERLLKSLQKTFGGHPGLDLQFDDFLAFDLNAYVRSGDSPVRIVGNIPYYLSAPILLRIFELARECQTDEPQRLMTATLMLQREVARRLCASEGGREYGGITVLRSLVADAELLFDVPPTAFIPPPRVTSSVISLRFYPKRRYTLDDPVRFNELVHTVFQQRRKMLKNSLGRLSWIDPEGSKAGFDLTRRPEEIGVEEFIRLFDLIKPTPGNASR